MIKLLMVLPLWTAALGADGDATPAPRPGSQLPADSNSCALCHTNPDFWEGDRLRLFISAEHVAEDLHGSRGVNCHDCHGGDPTTFNVPRAHSTVVDQSDVGIEPFHFPFDKVQQACGKCHQGQGHDLASGAHGQAGTQTGNQRELPLDCRSCHGEKAHGMASVRDPRSPVFVGKREQLCGDCHEKQRQEHALSAHGGTPPPSSGRAPILCTDCHGAHATRPAAEMEVTKMCAQCHQPQGLEMAAGVHGQAGAKGQVGDQGDPRRLLPLGCSACHGQNVHAIVSVRDPQSPVFAGKRTQLCGDCHEEQRQEHSMSAHGGSPPPSSGRAPVLCSDCHGIHATGPAADMDVPNLCAQCHESQSQQLASGVHGQAGVGSQAGEQGPAAEMSSVGAKGEPEPEVPHDCSACHGKNVHAIVSAQDPQSPVFVEKQLQLCGECHQQQLQEYDHSIHGQGLRKSGLVVTALCADCHGAHGILPATDENSSLHVTQVASTCAKCHRFIDQRLSESVHGGGSGAGGTAEKPAPGGEIHRRPSCTDCHQGHNAPRPQSADFRLNSANRCGICHVEQSQQYVLSLHGALSELGYGPAAKCSDCHGAHDILPVSDPGSRLAAGANRLETCKSCHPNSVPNFLDFDPHADHRDPERSFLLNTIYRVLLTLLIGTIGVFGLHSLFWFLRALLEVILHGRPESLRPGTLAFVRFAPMHRLGHTIMVISFLGLAATGLPLKYSQQEWARMLVYYLGGFDSTSLWHRIFGLVNIGCLVVYTLLMLSRLLAPRDRDSSWLSRVFGPDSPVPNFRDLIDFLKMIRWFLGLGPKPTFERWAYWEKVDMWGACADIVIIGFTGLVLWFPNFFCSFLPGETLNIAKVIHSTQALLATGFVFSIHFFSTHIRPDKFPLDMSILTGLVSEEEMKEERPEYFERLRREGRLEAKLAPVPARGKLLLTALLGLIAFSMGLILLAGILIALLGK